MGCIEAGSDAFEHCDLVSWFEGFREVLTDTFGAQEVIRTDKGDRQGFGFEDFLVEFVIDIDHDQSGESGSAQNRNERFGVGRGDDDRLDFGGDHFVDDGSLAGKIPFVLDAVDDQLVLLRILGLMLFCSLGHG